MNDLRPYEHLRLERKLRRALQLIADGKWIVSRYQIDQGGVPVMDPARAPVIWTRDYRNNQSVDGKTSWGYFSYDYDSECYILVEGTPPEGLMPRKLISGEVRVHNRNITITIPDRPPTEMEIRLDMNLYNESHIFCINKVLYDAEIPICVTKITYDQDIGKETFLRFTTENVMLFGTSAVWDTMHRQLVAAQIMVTDRELFRAFKATLANHAGRERNWVNVILPDRTTQYLVGAQRGYLQVASSMEKQSAKGAVVVLLHPVTGNPQEHSEEYFYIVTVLGDNILQILTERLDLAIHWPVLLEWASYLLKTGQSHRHGLIKALSSFGGEFGDCYRVSKDSDKWGDVIKEGLEQQEIILGGHHGASGSTS